MTAPPLLSVQDLSVAFGAAGVPAVDHVSFDIAPGETLALVGESGSGKSVTALSILKLLSYPAAHHPSGRILFKGRDLLRLRDAEIRRVRGADITMVFQEPMTSLNPLHTIERQVGEILALHRGLSGRGRRARVLELMDLVGIRDAASRLSAYPHQLSGGQRQRVMIAMALACEPALLVADEPTTALDVSVQAQIITVLKRMCRDHGTAVMLITHGMGVIAETADRVAVMYAGRVVEIGRVADVVRDPLHPYAQGLMGAIPTLSGEIHRLAQIPGAMPRLSAIPPGCAFNPRCPHAYAPCATIRPDLIVPDDRPGRSLAQHRVACHLYDPALAPRVAA